MPPKFSLGLQQPTILSGHLSYQMRTSPCEAACPAGNPIKKINALIREEKPNEALEYLIAKNPLAGVTGRICNHPCESACNRCSYDVGLSIRDLERFTAEQADYSAIKEAQKLPPSGKKVAVIGSGPAGMTCAYYCALLGHEVVVFEADPVLGGIPRALVPDVKLPKDIVDRQTGQILAMGVTARTNVHVGSDIAFETIKENFDACLIGVGSVRDRQLEIPGAQLALPALTFLRQANLGQKMPMNGRVVILGGGGVAFDCALAARRLGASEVSIICVEGEDCMCANPEDIQQARVHNIKILNSKLACEIERDARGLKGVAYFEVSGFAFDEACCLNVERSNDEIHFKPADHVISAIGVLSDFSFLEPPDAYSFTSRGTLAIDPDTWSTSVAGVFAAGDAVSGPSSVAEAIGSGRRAAISIHKYLTGKTKQDELTILVSPDNHIVVESLEDASDIAPQHIVAFEELTHIDYFVKKQRVHPSEPAPGISIDPFIEPNPGYAVEAAIEEAGRCFHCGQCFSCGSCIADCPGDVLSMGPSGPMVHYPDECWHCGNCRISCPCGAVQYEFPLSMLV